jgi:phosphate transport system substrate-binding protein
VALTEIGFIDQSVAALPYDKQSDRIANFLNAAPEDFDMQLMRGLLDELRGGQRLSVTLRFEAGAAQLDAESIQNLLRLVHYLERNMTVGQQIVLAGFADNSGPFRTNLALSEARANTVRDALLAASNGSLSPDQILVRGYSELVPVACNDTAAGRERNRRVEVWLPRQEQAPARAKLLIERL